MLGGCGHSGIQQHLARVDQRLVTLEKSNAQNEQAIEQTRQMALANAEETREATRLAEAARDLASGRVHRDEVRRVSVYFDHGSSTLTSDAHLLIEGVADEMLDNPGDLACVVGFADASGDPEFNDWLSQRRSEKVLRVLASRLGAAAFRVTYFGIGSERPVGDNDTEAGRRQNRRVEISLLRAEPGTTTPEVSIGR
jgi:outer membrane protein OmpA-like peptidoglycan-associated protein